MAEDPGTKLGHYRLVAPIGTGGFATVYRAVDERLDADVAIKILAENHALDVDIRERFITEAQLLRRLTDPAVVTVYDIGETARAQPFIVLSYADRGDLRTRVREHRRAGHRPDTDDLLRVASTLARALSRAHEAGLVHRDVTPDNLLITSAGGPTAATPGLLSAGERLQLGDLGLAKDLVAGSGFTVGGGTEGFSAPEQRSGMSRVDARADIYGASAVLFWLATSAAPPDDAASRALALMNAGTPAPIARCLERGLAAERNDRFATIRQWYDALTEGSTDGRTGQDPGMLDGALPRPVRRVTTRRWVAPATSLAIGAAAATGVWWTIGQPEKQTVTTLSNGQVKVERQVGDLRGAVFGPATASVGEQVTFKAAATGAASVRWIAPDGQIQEGNDLVVTASRAGQGRVTLVLSDTDGRSTTIEFDFEVTR